MNSKRGQPKFIYLVAMCSILLIALAALRQQWYLSMNLTSMYILYILLGLSNLCLTTKGISWDKIIGWSFFAYTIGVPLYVMTDGGLEKFIGSKMYYSEVYNDELIKESMVYNFLFLAAFYFAYFLFHNVQVKRRTPKLPAAAPLEKKYNYYHSKLLIHYWVLAGTGLFLFGMLKINYFSAISAGYSLGNSGYIYLFTAVFVINTGILILFRLTEFDKKYLIYAAFIHMLLFPLGIRQLTLTFVMQLFFLFKLTNPLRRIKPKEIGFGVVLMLLFGLVGTLRGNGAINMLSILKAPLSFFFYETTFNYISFLKCLELFRTEPISFLHGRTMLDPVIELVPSFIIGDKNSYQVFESFIAHYKPIQNLKPIGTAHLLTELFVNGGAASIVIFALIIGILGKIIQDKFMEVLVTGNRLGQVVFAAIIPFVIIQLNRGGLSVLIKLSVQFALLPIFIVILFRKEVLAGSMLLYKKMMNVRWSP